MGRANQRGGLASTLPTPQRHHHATLRDTNKTRHSFDQRHEVNRPLTLNSHAGGQTFVLPMTKQKSAVRCSVWGASRSRVCACTFAALEKTFKSPLRLVQARTPPNVPTTKIRIT